MKSVRCCLFNGVVVVVVVADVSLWKNGSGLCCYVQCISDTLTIYILNFVYFPLNKLHFDSTSLIPGYLPELFTSLFETINFSFSHLLLLQRPLPAFSHLFFSSSPFLTFFCSLFIRVSCTVLIHLLVAHSFASRYPTWFFFSFFRRFSSCLFFSSTRVFPCAWRIFIFRLTTVIVCLKFFSISFIISG